MQSLDLLPLMAMVVVFLLTTFCSPPYKSRNVKPLFSANTRNRGENCSFALHRVIIKKTNSATHTFWRYILKFVKYQKQ